jgi:hypothetical protein
LIFDKFIYVGELGTKFYVLIAGEAKVFIPKSILERKEERVYLKSKEY